MHDRNWTSSHSLAGITKLESRRAYTCKCSIRKVYFRCFAQFCLRPYFKWQSERVGVGVWKRENTRIVCLHNVKMTHFAGFRLKEKLMAWNGKILCSKTPWTCVLYVFIVLWIRSVCTLSACTHFDTLQRTIVAVKCKCSIAPKQKRKEKKRNKRMKEWMNETVNAMNEKEATDSSTYTDHVTLRNLCASHSALHTNTLNTIRNIIKCEI